MPAAMYLVKCSLPYLQQLDMGKHELDFEAAEKKAEGTWPNLE